MLISPLKLFFYALAFRFSTVKGQCFSPGIKALVYWYSACWYSRLVNRSVLKRWRAQWLDNV